ncbi:MAG TPA: PspC domain-containing protein [Burkholderiaceae bacterium]|nr:PspC domain-containing protein [Burkholderiaceae bacterium]
MTIADELAKLDGLRTRGVLSQEEFERAKARLLEGGPQPAPAMESINNLRRSITDSWVGGVCGGIARATGVESWIWRLIFVVLFLFGGTGLLLYILLWIFVPSE